ncbi:MAG: thioesterase, partial [Chloroflexia bacterium]|nr:thioesterase [Chloroflexia bacterium]
AGAGAVVYRPWRQALPSRVALSIVQLPGRETRLREDPVRRMELLIEALTEAVAPLAARPYALFGHSMGALVAFELARALRRIGLPLPVCLFVSGRRAPQLPETEPHVHQLADGPFVGAMVRRYNAIPRVILEDVELLRLFLPTLRADLELIETYTYTSAAPLGCPIIAFGGESDVRATTDDLAAWRAQTAAGFEVMQFPGGHFYLQTERHALIDQIVRALGGQQGAER